MTRLADAMFGLCSFAQQVFVAFNNTQQLHGACAYEAAADGSLPELNHLHLNFDCPLFARKFPEHTAGPMHRFLSDCNTSLKILRCDHNSSVEASNLQTQAFSSTSFLQVGSA